MSARNPTLPLGVDVGRTRTRVALCRRRRDGSAALHAVATRPTGSSAADALRDAWRELGTAERRCVVALSAPDAALHVVDWPRMTGAERRRAARYEAQRVFDAAGDDRAVRTVAIDGARWALGVTMRATLAARCRVVEEAGLRCVAVDDAALALLRALPDADLVIDLGARRTAVVAAADPIPQIATVEIGGEALTAAVIASLGIDAEAAERRKLSVGLAGAGEYAREALVEQLAVAVAAVRAAARREPRGVVMTGNAARLHGLPESLERAVSVPVRRAQLAPASALGIPADVLRNGSPDWALAYGLALWEAAG